MNRPQPTTTGGFAVLSASVTKAASLFNGYTFGEIGKALEHIMIVDAITAVAGIVVACLFIFYNEDKESNG